MRQSIVGLLVVGVLVTAVVVIASAGDARDAAIKKDRKTWLVGVPQYDTSGARVDPDALGWHGWPPSGAPANPCTLGAAQQNRC